MARTRDPHDKLTEAHRRLAQAVAEPGHQATTGKRSWPWPPSSTAYSTGAMEIFEHDEWG